jgi:radical SAM protein with 4Fe4S-binding SPASM domain
MPLNQKYVTVELTPECNNACRHCYNFWRQDGRLRTGNAVAPLSSREIVSLLRKIRRDAPVEYVALTGGEPCLRPDLPEIVNAIHDLGMQVIVITNGVLLTDAILKQLPSGLNFEITLFSHKATIHNHLAGRNVFDPILNNIARIAYYDSIFTLAFVATRQNAMDVRRTTELGLALGAGAVMYNRLNISRGMSGHAVELVPPRGMLEESLGMFQDVVREYGIAAVCSVPVPPCVVDTTQFPDLNFGWCPRGGENSYYTIGFDGSLRPCNHSSLVLGNLRKNTFADIVSRQTARDFWGVFPDECKDCAHPLKEQCRGGCTAAAMEFYGTPNRKDPICELS